MVTASVIAAVETDLG